MEKYFGGRQDITDNTIRRMRFACLVTEAKIQTRNQNIENLLLFHGCNSYANAPQCCVLFTLPILSVVSLVGLKRISGQQRIPGYC